MASAKRKQDEKNLKILRELVSQPGNKECFDCRQRGPTYVNVTIGSFVCTSCSGMLRGLTPPHRVKSISMATFTKEEIDFVKERGNEYCKRIWLGLMNPNSSHELDAKDEQKMKDLMSAKYELKRYYLDPSVANQNRNQNQNQSQSPNQSQNQSQYQSRNQNSSQKSGSTTVPRVPSSGTSSTLSVPIRSTKISEPIISNDPSTDFVADFSKVPDPFVGTTTSVLPQPFFANFDNNPVFDNAKNTDPLTPLSVNGGNANKANAPPSEDRYAALKDLDSLMKRTQLKEEATTITTATTTTTTWHTDNSNASNSIWSMGNHNTRVISNPFTSGGDLWRPSANLVNNNMQHIDSSLCNSANPFKPMQFSVNNDPQWMGIGSSGNGDAVQFGQFMTPLTNKVWQPTVPAYQANPFAVGSGVSNVTRNSNNPFL